MTAPAPAWTTAFLTMARELWIVKDRQRVLEALLAQHGILAPEAVSGYQPDAALQAALDAECRAWIERLLADLNPAAGD
jgi:hypothetical protein